MEYDMHKMSRNVTKIGLNSTHSTYLVQMIKLSHSKEMYLSYRIKTSDKESAETQNLFQQLCVKNFVVRALCNMMPIKS